MKFFIFALSSLIFSAVTASPKFVIELKDANNAVQRKIFFSCESDLRKVEKALTDFNLQVFATFGNKQPKSCKMQSESFTNDSIAQCPCAYIAYPENRVVELVEESSLSSSSANAVEEHDYRLPVESLDQWSDLKFPRILIAIDRKDIIGSATLAYKTILSSDSLSPVEYQNRNIQVKFTETDQVYPEYTASFLAIYMHKMFHETKLFTITRYNFISLPKIKKITPEILNQYEAFGYFLAKHLQTGFSIDYTLSDLIIETILFGQASISDESVADLFQVQLLMISLGFHRGCPVHLFQNEFTALDLQRLIRGRN